MNLLLLGKAWVGWYLVTVQFGHALASIWSHLTILFNDLCTDAYSAFSEQAIGLLNFQLLSFDHVAAYSNWDQYVLQRSSPNSLLWISISSCKVTSQSSFCEYLMGSGQLYLFLNLNLENSESRDASMCIKNNTRYGITREQCVRQTHVAERLCILQRPLIIDTGCTVCSWHKRNDKHDLVKI